MKIQDTLNTITDIAKVYPGIQGQLCCRHSTLYGKLRSSFNKLYDGMQPSHYVIVKGSLDILNNEYAKFSMGLQNGVVALVKRTYKEDKIFINSNHFSEQCIFSCEGKLQEGLHNLNSEMQEIIHHTNQQCNELYGCIIYIHCSIPQDDFHYQEVVLMALYLSILVMNQSIAQLNVKELMRKIADTKLMGDINFIERQFLRFTNNHFSLKVGFEQLAIRLQDHLKLVFCQLNLAKDDILYEQNRRYHLSKLKDQIFCTSFKDKGIQNMLDLFNSLKDEALQQLISGSRKLQLNFSTEEFLAPFLQEYLLLSRLNNKSIRFDQFVRQLWFNNLKLDVHSQGVLELVQQLQQSLKLDSYMIVHQKYLMIVSAKRDYTQLLRELRQKLSKGQLRSKSLFKIEETLVENRWEKNHDDHIGQKMFTASPSLGVAVFDPSHSIWFD